MAEEYYEKAMRLVEEIRSGLLPSERKNFFEVKIQGFARSDPARGLTRVRMKLNRADGSIDYKKLEKLAQEVKPKLLLVAIPRVVPLSLTVMLAVEAKSLTM